MATYQPPTENLPIFDPTVFAVSLAPLTQADADLLYLKFPTAQGTENLLAINVDGQAIFNSIASFPFALPTSTATVPAFTDSSTKIPTTAWVQGAITGAVPASILATNNTFTGTNAFNNIAPITSTATQPASTDSSTKIPTTAWVQTAVSSGSILATNNIFTGTNTFNNDLVVKDQITINDPTLVSTTSFSQQPNSFSIELVGTNPTFNIGVNASTIQSYNTLNNIMEFPPITTFINVAPPTSTATQPLANDSSTKIPTTAWVQTAIAGATPTIPNIEQVLIAGSNANNQSLTGLASLSVNSVGGVGGIKVIDGSAISTITQSSADLVIGSCLGSTTAIASSTISFYTTDAISNDVEQIVIANALTSINPPVSFTNITQGSLTSSAVQPASTDSSTKIPTTAWVQSAIAVGSAGTLADVLLAGDDANKKDIVNLNGLNIVTTSGGAPNISLTTGIFNSCNNGATYTANVITPPNTTIGDKKMRQYFARLYFDPLRASSTNATLYQSVQVRTTLTLGLDNNAEVNGTANGMTNWYSTATYGFNWNYMWNFNVAFVDNTSNSQGMTVLDGTSGSNNSGSWSGIDPTIYVEKIGSGPNINYLAFYWVNKKGSAGGSNAFWDISACFTLELLNIGQSLDATSSAWIAPYLSQVPE